MVDHAYGIRRAKGTAASSTCISSHYGAEIIDPVTKRPVGSGFNGVPRGMEHCNDKKWCFKQELGFTHFQEGVGQWAGLSYCLCTHAEVNAIAQAGDRAWGCWMYLWGERANGVRILPQPCFTCTKMIINAGITDVIVESTPGIYIKINPIALYHKYVKEMVDYADLNKGNSE